MRRTIAFVFSLLLLGTASAVGSAWFAAGVAHVWWNDLVLVGWGEEERRREEGAWFVVQQSAPDRRGWLSLSQIARERRVPIDEAEPPPAWSAARTPRGATRVHQIWRDFEFGWPVTWMHARRGDDAAHPRLDLASTLSEGIPIRCVEIEIGSTSTPPGGDDDGTVAQAFLSYPLLPTGIDGWRAVLAVGSWAVIWLALFVMAAALGRARAWLRWRRGRCGLCGHAVGMARTGGESVQQKGVRCPECGAVRGASAPFVSGGRVASIIVMALVIALADGLWAIFLVQRCVPPSRLHVAALAGDLESIRRELAAGAAVDTAIPGCDWVAGYSTPLMWAASAGNTDAIRLLLEAGADPGRPQPERRQFCPRTALGWAAMSGRLDAVEAILEVVAQTNAPFPPQIAGDDALNMAVVARRDEVLEWLLIHLPESTVSDGSSRSSPPPPLMSAAGMGHARALTLLLEYWRARLGSPADLSARLAFDWQYMPKAVMESGEVDAIRALMSVEGVTPDPSWLRFAADGGQRASIRELLRAGVRPECDRSSGAQQRSVLTAVIESGMNDLLEPLLRAGADPNCPADHLPPLAACARLNDEESARTLVEGGAIVGGDGIRWGKILAEIQWNRLSPSMGELLLSLPSSIDLPDAHQDDRTALMLAVQAVSRPWVERLLERGASPTAVDSHGVNVLHHAQRMLERVNASGAFDERARADAAAIVELITRAIEARKQPS